MSVANFPETEGAVSTHIWESYYLAPLVCVFWCFKANFLPVLLQYSMVSPLNPHGSYAHTQITATFVQSNAVSAINTAFVKLWISGDVLIQLYANVHGDSLRCYIGFTASIEFIWNTYPNRFSNSNRFIFVIWCVWHLPFKSLHGNAFESADWLKSRIVLLCSCIEVTPLIRSQLVNAALWSCRAAHV